MQILLFIIATWYFTVILTEEDGPFDIFYKLRRKTYNSPLMDTGCFVCMTVWVSMPFSLFYWYSLEYKFFIFGLLLYWLAIGGSTYILNTIVNKLDD